jgi:hypothetical protein
VERLILALSLLALIASAAGCGASAPARERARVRFHVEPANARVYVEDRFIGAGRVLARRPPDFPPGPRHFTITAEGYFPHDVEMDLPSGTTTVRLRLRPVPP